MADAPKQIENHSLKDSDISCPENVNYFSSAELVRRDLLPVNAREVFE